MKFDLFNYLERFAQTARFFVASALIFATVLHFLCRENRHFNGLDDENEPAHDRFFNRLYYAITTLSTVGYGDITANSKRARAITMLMMIFIVAEVSFP